VARSFTEGRGRPDVLGFKLTGDDELRQNLNRIGAELRGQYLAQALMRASRPIVMAAKSTVPKKTLRGMRSISAEVGDVGGDKFGWAWLRVGPGPETEVAYTEQDTRKRKTSRRVEWRTVSSRSGAKVATRRARDRTVSYLLFSEYGTHKQKKTQWLKRAVKYGKGQFNRILRLELRRLLLMHTR